MRRATSWMSPLPRGWLAVGAATATILVIATAAGAATQQRSQTIDFKDTKQANVIDTGEIKSDGTGICNACVPDLLSPLAGATGVGARLQGGLEVEWTNPVKYDLSYTDSLVRQGETLDMKDVVATQGGKVKVSVFVSGFIGIYQRDPDTASTPWALNSTVLNDTVKKELGSFDCTIPLPGESPRQCKIGEQETTVFTVSLFDVVSLDVKVKFELFFDSSGTPISSMRLLTTAGNNAGGLQKTLSFEPTSPVALQDDMQVPCTEPAGNDVFYKLTQNSYSAQTDFSTTVSVLLAPSAVGYSISEFPVWSNNFKLLEIPGLQMKAPDLVENLGPLQPDNRPPVVSGISAPNGDEGSQIQFQVDATDNCGPPSIRWDFSDGGVAFGATPRHTFNDNGTYTGQITVKDDTGNTTTKNFALTVANQKPSVNAGPDDSADWGRAVQFNGQATDPGSGDQPTLQYTWDFGDGSPSATAGPGVAHAYAQPGTYTATLTVQDKDGGSASDTRQVVVTKRDTSIGYLGDTAGTFDTPASLTASLVDEYGQTVNGRLVSFQVGSDGPQTALTNSSGIAAKSYTPVLAAGSYTGSSSFAGDLLYRPSASSNGFVVAKKGTTVVYTGAVTGAPNKVVILSAVLKDVAGKPLGGRTIAFGLGTQAATAVTDGNGVAATSVKLTQKNGTYTVAATYLPGLGDSPYYLGSSQSTIFKLQAR